ncbi:amino acid permease [Pullulanibacillus sp. KACC 23026]|uniref:amino acid permease n=1 Tax=Pullulanibacillus sp. KACC 23026 TaxID=3028315 RepID=UPI0023AF7B7F|nr:amino acid permease [Pullulanibacillus sp. KACC 23026]WEG10924.1 amino acid permease [Pullulanibacillus sp. KACC 23026]
MSNKKNSSQETHLSWWQLSLVGIGCIIGTGFFLGSSLGIRMAGPSILIAFIIAAFATYVVYDALAKMTAKDPAEGSFRSYAKKAFGRWAGFSSGWVYWSSEMLIMGSQMTALALFSRFWFPRVPLWAFAAGYAVLGILVVLMGASGFDRLENLFAVIKVAAIIMFILLAALACMGWLHHHGTDPRPHIPDRLMPHGFMGLWSSFIYALYGFGGVEMMGLMAIRLKDKNDAPKAGRMMLILLVTIYLLSIGLAVTMVSWNEFTDKESPFVIALKDYHVPFFPHVFNGALIIAGFSTMSASLFSVTSMMSTLAKEGDAPSFFSKKTRRNIPVRALILTISGMAVSVIMGLLMPRMIYEYITTAAGLMLIYNWLFILFASKKLLELTFWGTLKNFLGIILIVLAVIGTVLHKGSRPGLFISFLFLLVIGSVIFLLRKKWNKEKGA